MANPGAKHPGGRPKGYAKTGGGSRKGCPNKATADIKALAQKHTAKAMAELARIALEAESEAARVAAIKELFDRGYGKARQPLGGEGEGDPIELAITVIERRIVDRPRD